jgi:hypothetical protein
MRAPNDRQDGQSHHDPQRISDTRIRQAQPLITPWVLADELPLSRAGRRPGGAIPARR